MCSRCSPCVYFKQVTSKQHTGCFLLWPQLQEQHPTLCPEEVKQQMIAKHQKTSTAACWDGFLLLFTTLQPLPPPPGSLLWALLHLVSQWVVQLYSTWISEIQSFWGTFPSPCYSWRPGSCKAITVSHAWIFLLLLLIAAWCKGYIWAD